MKHNLGTTQHRQHFRRRQDFYFTCLCLFSVCFLSWDLTTIYARDLFWLFADEFRSLLCMIDRNIDAKLKYLYNLNIALASNPSWPGGKILAPLKTNCQCLPRGKVSIPLNLEGFFFPIAVIHTLVRTCVLVFAVSRNEIWFQSRSHHFI